MEQAQEPGHAATEGVEPDHPATGPDRPRRANRSLRVRMIGAVLVAGVATVAVGGFGINRMSALSAEADVVYAEGTVPVDALRKLQVDWWELQTHIARANIEALPPESRASSQEKAAAAGQTLAADVEAAADLPLSPDAAAAFGEFAGATQQYLALVAQIQQIVTDAQDEGRRRGGPAGRRPAAERGRPAGRRRAAGCRAGPGPGRDAAADRPDERARGDDRRLRPPPPRPRRPRPPRTAAAEARDAYEAARTLTLIAIAVAVVLSLAIGLLVARSVRRPVQRMRDVLGQVADGDLTVRAGTVGGGAELGEMAASLDTTLDALGNVLGLVNDSAGRLAGASTAARPRRPRRWRDNARTAATQADEVVASAGEVASSVDTVATGSVADGVRRSARSRTTPPRRPAWPVRRSRSPRRPPGRSASSATRRRRSPR